MRLQSRIIDTMAEGVMLTRVSDGAIFYTNPRFGRMFGYQPEELVGSDISVVNAPTEKNPKEVAAEIAKVLNENGEWKGEVYNIRKDGIKFWCHANVSTFEHPEHGKVWISVHTDITERKQAEDALKESEQKYRTLIDNMQDGVVIIQDEKVQFANDATARISGYGVKELIGMDFREHVTPENMEVVANNYQRRQAGESVPKEYEFSIQRKDGTKAFLNMTVGLITYQGKVASMVTLKDITERKRAIEALRESEDRYRRLVDFSPFGIAIHSDGKIEYANLEAMKILGAASLEALFGRPLLQIIHPEYHEIVKERVRKLEQGEIAPLIEEKFVRLDGTPVDVEITAIPFIFRGKQAVYGVFQEITERKRAEEQIRSSLREKEVLLREIHHRVKNNMQLISSLLRLQSRYAGEEKYREMLMECQNRIVSMALIHEKLYRSRDMTKIDLKDYIRDLINNLSQSHGAAESRVDVSTDVEDISLGIDLATPCGLIINELVNNSLKHAFPDRREGKITVTFKRADEKMFELRVSDNGIGIPEGLDFRKTESLGLRLVTILVEDQLEGEISLDRSKGTEFRIKFKGDN
ncbi:Methyl sulfide methyltransferase-associated sensor [uncultured archaeon]|nr:Methyl sulfide methyltransferase-associated sensor [uncultured archaeon]